MKNVYDAVNSFYEQNAAWNEIIRYEWVESFLRKKAWQKMNDKDLKKVWQHILMFTIYLAYADIPIQNAKNINCKEMLDWQERNIAEFKKNNVFLKGYFNTLLDFQNHLLKRKVIFSLRDFQKDIDINLYRKGNVPFKRPNKPSNRNEYFTIPDPPTRIYLNLDDYLQKIILRLNDFYQKTEYVFDFERAMFFYCGVMGLDEDELESRKQDFWFGFWDYFLFDYRLLSNDKTPLKNFYDSKEYTEEEKSLLVELVEARFSVFSIKQINENDIVECEDLFTGDIFYLPISTDDFVFDKDVLFMGHLFSDNMILLNYVISVPVSVRLKKRIKEDVLKQISYFRVQKPEATWEDFFKRHAIAVRHTIDIFTTFSKLNAVLDVEMPEKKDVLDFPVNEDVKKCLVNAMKTKRYSLYDQRLAMRMWADFCGQKDTRNIRKPELWAAAVLANFSYINSAFEVDYKEIAKTFNISLDVLKKYKNILKNAIDLKECDLRYLNEEGFIMLLMG